jgi:hypothetical protein
LALIVCEISSDRAISENVRNDFFMDDFKTN